MNEAGGWVVDASVAAKWYLRDEEHVGSSLALLDSYRRGETPLLAPHFIRYEVARSLLRAEQERRISQGQAASQLDRFVDLGLHMPHDPHTRLVAAQDLSRALRVSFYDALYLALAEEADFQFVTADAELYHRVHEDLPYVTWIGDVPSS